MAQYCVHVYILYIEIYVMHVEEVHELGSRKCTVR